MSIAEFRLAMEFGLVTVLFLPLRPRLACLRRAVQHMFNFMWMDDPAPYNLSTSCDLWALSPSSDHSLRSPR